MSNNDKHPDDDFFQEVPKNSIHDNSPEYETGYGRPPVSHQFKKGQSGNPNGRPKTKNRRLEEDIKDILETKHVTGGQELSLRQMILRQIFINAAKGDNTKLRMSLPFLSMADGIPEFIALPEDAAILKKFAARLKKMEE